MFHPIWDDIVGGGIRGTVYAGNGKGTRCRLTAIGAEGR